MKRVKAPQMGMQTARRTIDVAVRQVESENRKVELSFSSEQAVVRWFGQEILCHDADCIDLNRLNEIGVVLFNHNRDKVLGRIEKAWLGSDLRCYATVVFDADEDAEKIFQKVQSKTLKGVSVGYGVDVWEEVAAGKKSSNGRFTGPAWVAVRWYPYEISIVSVPADDGVGVGREMDEPLTVHSREGIADKNTPKEEKRMDENDVKTNEPAVQAERAVQLERQRVSEITAMCRDFNVDPAEHIQNGTTVDQVRATILEKMKTERQASPAAQERGVKVSADEADKFRAAAADSILLRAGKTIENAAEGARELRGMKLRDLAIECLQRAGRAGAHKLSDDDLFREVLSSDSQFASILSNAVNKTMATSYKGAPTTFQAWTGKGSNPDFKPSTVYQISEAGGLVQMTQSGEFKADEMKDNGVTKALATFGREFKINRQALINDDIGVLTRVPEAYVRAARRGINALVYKMLGNNPIIYDGVSLFHADHGNLGTAGIIGTATVGELRRKMRLQKNIRGLETLNIAPSFMIVPAALETDAQKFLNSVADPNGAHAGVANVFRNSLNLVVDAELDTYSSTAYYLAASAGDVDTIEVTYLNGDEMPKLESRMGFDFLGIEWRIYADYGVTILDYRGLAKNAGQ